MKFEYESLMKLIGFSEQQIQFFKSNTGYGKLFSNYEEATAFNKTQLYQDVVIPINQCNDCNFDYSLNNCFVIFESDYLPVSFLDVIQRQTGYILVNSKWMKQVVIKESDCDPERIIILPYLQNFERLSKYKKIKDNTKNQEVLTFYTIADNKDVKGLKRLIKAFDLALSNNKQVQLIIKTSNGQQLVDLARGKRNINVIDGFLSQMQLYKLHARGDVYISTAYSVGWQIPPFQASFLGKHLICGYHSAFTEWVNPNKATILQSYKKIIPLRQYSGGRFKNKHSSGWLVNMIDVDQIANKLKYVYDNTGVLRNQNIDVREFEVKNIDRFLEKNLIQE